MRVSIDKRLAVVLSIFLLTHLVDGICLIESESEKDTSKVVPKSNGSTSYGLFQINSKKWCKVGRKGGLCNVACEDLLNDDIKDDCECAQKIFDAEGLKSWSGWLKRCKSGTLPDISNCPDLTPPPARKISESEMYRVSPPRNFRFPQVPILG